MVEACPLCANEAATERSTETFYECAELVIVRDLDLDNAPDRLLAYAKQHGEVPAGLRTAMRQQLGCLVAARFPGTEWRLEVTLRTCPEHGWHIHARKVLPGA